jgi:hypothetical protein
VVRVGVLLAHRLSWIKAITLGDRHPLLVAITLWSLQDAWHGGRQLRYAFDSSPGLQAALAVAWRRLTGSAHSSKSLIFSTTSPMN